MLFAIGGIFARNTSSSKLERPTPQIADSSNKKVEQYKMKINGESSWKPKGWGSGEYLQTIPKIKSGAVIDLDSGDVLWSLNLKQKIAPASLTKVATIMTALDVASVDKVLTVDEQSAEQIPTKLGLKEGEKLKLSEAIEASLLTSANDAAETISQSIGSEIGGGTDDFMKLVNEKLRRIGATDTHFETSTGLDNDDHFSTVFDLAIIAHEALTKYPFISQVASEKFKRLDADSNHKLYDLPNWNALLGTYPGVNGLKIGYTEKAGHATMVSANRDGHKLLAIVIGANSLEDREMAAATLLNYGYEHFGISAYALGDINLVQRYEDWRRELTMGNFD